MDQPPTQALGRGQTRETPHNGRLPSLQSWNELQENVIPTCCFELGKPLSDMLHL